jgi:hypothetical protein
MVLRRIFGPKREEVTRGRRKLPNGEFQNLYSASDIIKIMELTRMKWLESVVQEG